MRFNSAEELGYVIVTDYVKANTGEDVSDAIQKVIDENPNRTIFFPDGEYILAKSIMTPAAPEKSVALKLSNYAILRASADWNSDEAMVRLGAIHSANDINTPGSNYFFEGGIIDGNNVANGLSIDGGRETAVRYVSIKRTFIGLYIKYGVNNCSSDCDIDTVNIVGNGKPGSIGLLIDACDNTLTNMRIASVQIGVKVNHASNFFRNIHPLFIYEPELVDHYQESYGFYDTSSGNWYDMCYSDQFATAFYMGPRTMNIYDICRSFWYSPAGNKQVGFEAARQFNSVLKSCEINFRFPKVDGKYITVAEEGGTGSIDTPLVNDELCKDDTYKKYTKGNVTWRPKSH